MQRRRVTEVVPLRLMKERIERRWSAEEEQAMPDGSRKRRHSFNCSKRQWYARHRARRFFRRFCIERLDA